MLCTCVNDVHALTHVNTVDLGTKTGQTITMNGGVGGSVTTGTTDFKLYYTFSPQLNETEDYVFHVVINPSFTLKQYLGTIYYTRNWYLIVGGYKYYFDANNQCLFKIEGSQCAPSVGFTIGCDITYQVESNDNVLTDEHVVGAYGWIEYKVPASVMIYTSDNSDADSLLNGIQQGNNLQQQENQLQQENNNLQQQENQLQQEQNQTTNNIFGSISDFFGSFFDNLIGIFVPESGYFEQFFARLNTFFSEKLGMLYSPIELFINLLTAIQNAKVVEAGIPFPGLEWEGMYIIKPQTISLSEIASDFPGLQDKIYFVTDVIMVGAVVMLLQNKLKEILTT